MTAPLVGQHIGPSEAARRINGPQQAPRRRATVATAILVAFLLLATFTILIKGG
jgi:hypothetical protein